MSRRGGRRPISHPKPTWKHRRDRGSAAPDGRPTKTAGDPLPGPAAQVTRELRPATADTIIHSILPSVQIDYCYMNLVMRAIKTLSEWRNTRVVTNYKPGRANLFLSTEHH